LIKHLIPKWVLYQSNDREIVNGLFYFLMTNLPHKSFGQLKFIQGFQIFI